MKVYIYKVHAEGCIVRWLTLIEMYLVQQIEIHFAQICLPDTQLTAWLKKAIYLFIYFLIVETL